MTRQRLREGSTKWETQLSLSSFSQKVLKKIKHLAFSDRVKIIKAYIPEKVKIFIETNLLEEMKYFQKKYLLKIELYADHNLIIPEYKIDLLNKSKKIISNVENINKIIELKNVKSEKDKKIVKKNKKDVKKKTVSKVRTLWVRRKKRIKSNP